jgi:hypothetical protein
MKRNFCLTLLRGAPIVLCAALLSAASASATTIFWNLQGVTFSDGGTASGSFGYDDLTNNYSFIDITTTAGSSFNGATYFVADPGVSSSATRLVAVLNAGLIDKTGTPVLVFSFGPALTSAGGIVNIGSNVGSAEGACANAQCTTGIAARSITAGIASTVPEPSSLTLVPLGAVALLVIKRRLMVR